MDALIDRSRRKKKKPDKMAAAQRPGMGVQVEALNEERTSRFLAFLDSEVLLFFACLEVFSVIEVIEH